MQNRELVGREKGSRLALKGVERLEEGMKKAGGPIWPTAQRFIRRLYRLALPLGGRRSPGHGEAAAHSGGCRRILDETAHDTPRMRLPVWQTRG